MSMEANIQLISNQNLARCHRRKTLCSRGVILGMQECFLLESKGLEGAALAQANFRRD